MSDASFPHRPEKPRPRPTESTGTTAEAPPERKPRSSPRKSPEEQAIVERLQQTRRQVKRVDLVVTLATMLTAIFVYLLVGAVLDQWVARDGLGFVGRTLLFVGLVGGGTVFFISRLWPLIRFQVNPVYAASILEQCRPGFKNGLINWLLLRSDYRRPRHPLQQRIYQGLTRSANADLQQTPREMVVDHGPIIRWGIALVAVVAIFCLYLILSPKNPIVSAGRVLLPWSNIRPPQSVTFSEIEPGDAVVFQGETLLVQADVDRAGEQPVHLVYSTLDERLVDQHVPMTLPEGDYRHQCRFPPDEEGFQEDVAYHLECGDAKSASYRVTVRPALAIDVVSISYDYPEYTRMTDQVVRDTGDLRAVEGTRATLRVRANSPIARAMILPDGEAENARRMKVDADDRHFATGTLLLRFDPEDPENQEFRTYLLRFFDEDDNANPEPSLYRIEVIPDRRPKIRWIDPPTEQVQLPRNGRLEVAFRAEDPDFGLRHLRRHLQTENEDLPTVDLIESPRTKPVTGKVRIEPKTLGLSVGKQYEYHVEAIDTKRPDPNTATTPKLSFLVTDPQEAPSASESGNDGSTPPEDRQENADDAGEEQEQPEPQKTPGKGEQESEKPQQESGESRGEEASESGSEASDAQSGAGEDSASGENRQEQPKDPPPGSAGENEAPQETPEDTHQQKDQQQGPKQGGGTSSGRPDENQQKGSPTESERGGAKSSEGGSPSDRSTGSENQGAGEASDNTGQGNRKKPIDGKSNPGDVFEEVLEHMNEKKESPPEASDSGPTDGQDSDREETGEEGSAKASSEKDGTPAEETAAERTPGQFDPETGEETEEGTPPEELPANEREAREGDEKDAYRAESGESGPGAEKADDQKPIYQDPDDPNAGEETDEEATGKTSKPWERDASDTPEGEPGEGETPNRSDRESNAEEAEEPGSRGREASDGSPEKTEAPGESGEEGSPSDADQPPRQTRPQDPPPDDRNTGGTGGESNSRETFQPEGAAEADAANREYAEKATSLALEYLEDQLESQQPDEELMDKLGWSRAELESFVRRWREMAEAAKSPRADEASVSEWNESLKSLGLAPRSLRQKHRSGDGIRTPTLESRRYQPPPGWRERFRAYTRGMADGEED